MTQLQTRIDGPVVHLSGDLTADSEEAISSAFEQARASDVVVLDFSELDYMNSTGIGLLVTTLIRAQRFGVRLTAAGLNDHYREIFSLTRLEEAIPVYDSPAEALSS